MNARPLIELTTAAQNAKAALGLRYTPEVFRDEGLAFSAAARAPAGWENPFADLRLAVRTRPVYGTEMTGMRAFTQAESAAVIASARAICERLRVARFHVHRNRDWCYQVFQETGLRHLEMKCLPWAVVFLDAEDPYIQCRPDWNKNGTFQEVPLTARAVRVLRAQREFSGQGALVWPGVPSLNTLNRDMLKAGVLKIDLRGRPAGFHSFRKELNTEAAKLGLPIDARMRLMRHTDPRLTMLTYSDLQRKDLGKLIARFLSGRGEGELSTSDPPAGKNDLTKRVRSDEDQAAERRAGLPPVDPNDCLGADPSCPARSANLPLGGSAPKSRYRALRPRGAPKTYGGNKLASIGGSNPPLSACSPDTCSAPHGPREDAAVLVEALITAIANGVVDALHRISGSASDDRDHPS